MKTTSRLLATVALVASLGACRSGPGRAPAGEPPQTRLARFERVAATSDSTNLKATVAATTYLLTGDPARAEAHLTGDVDDPLASMLRAELARERLDERALAQSALAVIQRAPESPWAELAGVRLAQLAQESPATDELIESALSSLDNDSMQLKARGAMRAREALLSVRHGRNDVAAAGRTRRALGIPEAWTIVGPLEAYRLADLAAKSPFDDPRHALAATYPSPSGEVVTRTMPTRDGVLSIEREPRLGDVFEALVDLDVKRSGEHLVSLRGATMATVWIDGVQVQSRRAWPYVAPLRSWGAVDLPAGKHRLRVRFTRSEASWFVLELPRVDGAPTAIDLTAPKPGPAPEFSDGVKAIDAPGGALVWAETVLADDPADPVASWARVLALQPDDPERAQDALDQLLVAAGGETVPVRSLRMDLVARDPDLPRATARSRVQRDVEAILAKQPNHLRALVLRFDDVHRDKQWDDAAAVLAEAKKAARSPHPRLLLREARLALSRGNRAQARRAAEQALKADPGRCEALDLRTDLARADDENAVAGKLMPELARCPGGVAANASWLRGRGRLLESITLLRQLVDRSPSSFAARRALAEALWAQGDLPGAVAALEPAVTMWPRRNDALEELASLHERAGDRAAASELRRRALRVDGSDISLARAVALDAGTEVMPWASRDGISAIDGFKSSGTDSNAGAVQVLDLGAFEVQPDGSALERVHSIVKVIDKRGIDKWGEVTLPGDAQALAVRTVKADGRILEAEIIAGKESISMPNLEPGDFVEAEWVRAHDARPASLPGWQGGMFFFRAPGIPFHESVYEVRAPKAQGLEVQARNVKVSPPELIDGDVLRFHHTARNAEPFIREPASVGDSELLPWVEAGAGAGEFEAVKQFADWALLSTRPTGEVRRLVHGLSSKPVPERVLAVIERVRETVRGNTSTASFRTGAGYIIAGERGNRLVALKAALTAVGIPSHVVLVRSFTTDPEGFRFPRGELFSRAVLRVDPPGEESMWIDFANRYAPVGKLPVSLSGLEGVVVPAPGEQPVTVKLPTVPAAQDTTAVDVDVRFTEDGTLVGTMQQVAYGFDAASLRQALERTSLTELKRHQESSLAATFPRVVLEDLKVEDSGRPEDPVTVVSTLRAPGYGQRADGVVALPANFGQVRLSRRFLSRGERQTPLMMSSTHHGSVHARLTLPPGATVTLPDDVEQTSDFGRYTARFGLSDGVLSFDEELVLERGRVPPEDYARLASFAAAVDAAQARELPLEALP